MENEVAVKSQRKKGCAGILIVLTLIILGVGTLIIWWRYYYTYSEGNRYGLLQKFSRRGNVFKTYEGEMILSSVKSSANVPIASEKFFFSVTDEAVAEQLRNLQGRQITVHYTEKKSAAFWRGDSNYIVDSVRIDQ